MILWIASVGLATAGIAVFVCAERFSDFENRLKIAYPSTKVTGWSGTKKGVLAWRFIGILVIFVALFFALSAVGIFR
jgi:hypothetical protein